MKTVLESLNGALKHAFAADERVFLLGEDVLDPYGGAFKVTRGLSTAFPERVYSTPVSEAGITGVAAGMALRGLRPVVEIMFGDFVMLVADQLVNHLAKFRWMYNDQVRLPVVVRTPMGGRRGYGPTHSQSLEKLYLGIPGLRVLAPCALGDPGYLLYRAILEGEDPVLFVENKLLYSAPLQDENSLEEFTLSITNQISPDKYPTWQTVLSPFAAPVYTLSVKGAPPASLTMTCYSYTAELARQAMRELAYEHEVFTELVVPTQLSPFINGKLLDSLQRTENLLVVEEGTLTLGWGAEILARTTEASFVHLQSARRLASHDLPIPASGPLESAVLPGASQIIQAVLEIAHSKR